MPDLSIHPSLDGGGFCAYASRHMRFSNDALDEFRRIYQDEFGEEITRDQAQEMGTRVVTLLRLLLRPLPSDSERTPPGAR